MTDREKLEKVRDLLKEVLDNNLHWNVTQRSIFPTMDHYVESACAMLPKSKRFEVRKHVGPNGESRGYYIWDMMQGSLASSYHLTQVRANELCDLLNKGHEATADA